MLTHQAADPMPQKKAHPCGWAFKKIQTFS